MSRQARQSLSIEGHGPILTKLMFLKSLRKIIRNMSQLGQSDESLLKVGVVDAANLGLRLLEMPT